VRHPGNAGTVAAKMSPRLSHSGIEDVTLVAERRDKSHVYGESNMHQDHPSVDLDT
jgi:hypothetical protein